MAERKLVIVNDNGILHELGGIGGPICTPTRIPIDAILKMINNKRHVFECDPSDPRNTERQVRLTQANYKSDNFGTKSYTEEATKETEQNVEVPGDVSAKPVEPGTKTTEVSPQTMEHTNDETDVVENVQETEIPVEAAPTEEATKETEQNQSKTGNKSKKKK